MAVDITVNKPIGGTPSQGGIPERTKNVQEIMTNVNPGLLLGSGTASSSRQWIKACSAIVASENLYLDDMHCQFTVKKTENQQQTYCYFRYVNPSKSHGRQLLQAAKEYNHFELNAGYKQRNGVIFKGQIAQVRLGKMDNGTDTYFDILATSNQQAYGYATVNKTLAAGSTYQDQLDECLKAFEKYGVSRGFVAELAQKKFPRAVTLFGLARHRIRQIAQANNMNWSIQDEKFQMTKVGEGTGDVKQLNSDSGMIGLPEQTLQGIKAKFLLDSGTHVGQMVHIDEDSIQMAAHTQLPGPNVDYFKMGDKNPNIINLPSLSLTGDYIIASVEHEGDLEGQTWYTTITCLNPAGTTTGDRIAAGRAVGSSQYTRDVPSEDQGRQQ